MKMKRLTIVGGVAVLVLLGYNGLISRLATQSQRQRAVAALAHLPANADVVFLGNSLMEAGGDPIAFGAAAGAQHPTPPLNLALGATSPVEHCLIWQNALARDLHPRWLIYGYFDDQLNAMPSGDWADLVGNRAISYYFPAQAAELYAPGSSLKRWELLMTGSVPIVSERSSLWTLVERWRRSLEAIGLPAQKTNRFGRVNDFGPTGPDEIASFNRRCGAITEQQSPFVEPIRQIIKLAQEHHVQVIFVEMPMPSRHRQTFYATPVWQLLRQQVQKQTQESGALYLNASEWVNNDAQFEDAMHLNQEGARVFSTRLADTLRQLEKPTGNFAALPMRATVESGETREK